MLQLATLTGLILLAALLADLNTLDTCSLYLLSMLVKSGAGSKNIEGVNCRLFLQASRHPVKFMTLGFLTFGVRLTTCINDIPRCLSYITK